MDILASNMGRGVFDRQRFFYLLFWIILMHIWSTDCQSNGDIRLHNGSARHEGIVEEYSVRYGEWINFCVDGFDGNDARVVCRNLGYPDAAFGLDTDAVFGSDTTSYYAVALDCEGSESRLIECSYRDIPNCVVGFGAAVVCQKPDYLGCYSKPNSSVLHTHASTSSTMTVDECLGNCRAAGYPFAWTFDSQHCGCGYQNVVSQLSKSDQMCACPCAGDSLQTCGGPTCAQGSDDLIAVYRANMAFCPDPGNSANGRRTGNWFRFGSKVTYDCEAGYRLKGKQSIQCIQAIAGGPVQWSHPTPTCTKINTKEVVQEKTTLSSVDRNSSMMFTFASTTASPTRDMLNLSQLSGDIVGVVAAVPVTLIIIAAVILIIIIRRRRKRFPHALDRSVRCDFQLKGCPTPVERAPSSAMLRKISTMQRGSLTLPIRKISTNSNDYYASIDLCGDADYENIARKKIDVRTGKELFVPLYGSRMIHSAKSGILARTFTGHVSTGHWRVRDPQLLAAAASNGSVAVGADRRSERERDAYEDTTIMVDNEMYASRDEFPDDERQGSLEPEPKSTSTSTVMILEVADDARATQCSEDAGYSEADFLPEEATQG